MNTDEPTPIGILTGDQRDPVSALRVPNSAKKISASKFGGMTRVKQRTISVYILDFLGNNEIEVIRSTRVFDDNHPSRSSVVNF